MQVRSLPSAGLRDRLPMVAMAAAAALLVALLILTLFLASKIIVLAILAALGAVLALWISGNPRLASLWLLIMTAPLGLSLNFVAIPHMGGAGSYSIDLSDPFVVMLAVFLVRDRLAGYRARLHVPATSWWWIGMMALGVLSAAIGPLRHTPLQEVLRMGKLLLLFLVLVNELVRVRHFLHLASAISCALLVQSLIAILQFLLNRDLGLQVLGEAAAETLALVSQATYMGGGAVFRVSGLLGHPNLLSGTLALLLPLVAAVLISSASKVQKLLAGSALLLGSVALLLTLSRSGWLAFALGFATFLTLSLLHPNLRNRYVMARVAMIAVMVIGAIIFAPQIIKRFTESDPGALNFRYEWMQVAWHMIRQEPLLGLGLNSFVFYLPGNSQYGGAAGLTERFGEVWPVVHNIYLLTWAEQGTLGFLLFVGLHFSIFRVAIRNARNYVDDSLFALNLACLGGFVAIVFDGIGSFYLRSLPGGRMFWIVVAVIHAIAYWNRANAPLRVARQPASASP